MLGPAAGYALASMCLRVYIVPYFKPIVNDKDPRWLGAWWMGWLIIGCSLLFFSVLFAMFPKELPRAAARRMVEEERRKKALKLAKTLSEKEQMQKQESEMKSTIEEKASWEDMKATFKRLLTNKTLMYNNLSSVFYLFGYTPYWIFSAKYIEIQYRQSAATSRFIQQNLVLRMSSNFFYISVWSQVQWL